MEVDDNNTQEQEDDEVVINKPSPRFGAKMAFKSGHLFLFGGTFESGDDVTYTLKDMYSLDVHKMDEWKTIIESDLKEQEWIESESEDDDDDEEEDESSDDDN